MREKAAMTGEVKSGADESPFSIGLRRRRGLLGVTLETFV